MTLEEKIAKLLVQVAPDVFLKIEDVETTVRNWNHATQHPKRNAIDDLILENELEAHTSPSPYIRARLKFLKGE